MKGYLAILKRDIGVGYRRQYTAPRGTVLRVNKDPMDGRRVYFRGEYFDSEGITHMLFLTKRDIDPVNTSIRFEDYRFVFGDFIHGY